MSLLTIGKFLDFSLVLQHSDADVNNDIHFRLFRIKLHCNFAQAQDIFADDAVVESTDGLIDATGIRNRIYSGILEGKSF